MDAERLAAPSHPISHLHLEVLSRNLSPLRLAGPALECSTPQTTSFSFIQHSDLARIQCLLVTTAFLRKPGYLS